MDRATPLISSMGRKQKGFPPLFRILQGCQPGTQLHPDIRRPIKADPPVDKIPKQFHARPLTIHSHRAVTDIIWGPTPHSTWVLPKYGTTDQSIDITDSLAIEHKHHQQYIFPTAQPPASIFRSVSGTEGSLCSVWSYVNDGEFYCMRMVNALKRCAKISGDAVAIAGKRSRCQIARTAAASSAAWPLERAMDTCVIAPEGSV